MPLKLSYGTFVPQSGANAIIDLFRDQSMVLSKNHEYTTRDGHLKGVLCDITVQADAAADFEIYAMPNTWKLRNGMRKFHFLRDHMFRESGVTKSEMGKYGKTIRPYLDARHVTGTATTVLNPQLSVFSQTDPGLPDDMTQLDYTGGEWTRTRFATVPLYEEPVGGGGPEGILNPADEWVIHLADSNVPQATSSVGTTVSYSSVGVVHSYNLDRQSVQTQTTNTSLDGPNNPLAALAASGNQATGEILDIAEEQEEELPPYSSKDDGDSVKLTRIDRWAYPSTYGATHTFRNVFIPAGLFRVGSSIDAGSFNMIVEVLANVECRDMVL